MPPDITSEIDTGEAGVVTRAPGRPDSNGQPGDGTSAGTKEEYRTLAELNELAKSGSLKMNDTEKKRSKIAVTRGLSSDDEIDAILNGQADGKGDSAKSEPAGKVTGDDNTDNEPGEDEETETPDNNIVDDGGGGDDNIDSQLLNAIGPHLQKAESVEDAVQAIKDLEHRANRGGEFVNRAEKLGIKSVEDLEKTVRTLDNIDRDIVQRLSSPAALQTLYEDFGIPVPKGILNGTAPPSNGQNRNQPPGAPPRDNGQLPQELEQYLTDIEEDGFIGAKQFKELIPALANNIQKNLEAKYEQQNQRFDQVGKYVANLAKQSAQTAAVNNSFQEAREISSKFSKFDESLSLTEDPSVIWKESVGPGNIVKKTTHPEWGKLANILQIRKLAIDEKMSEYKQRGVKNGRPDVMAILSKKFITTGQLSKIQANAGKSAKSNLVSQLATKLQPSLHGKRQSGSEGFKTPKSNSDVKNMSKDQRKMFFAKLKRGDIRVGL